VIGYVKCLANRKFAPVENGAGSGRFLRFALGTPAGMRGFPLTGIGVPAFPAGKTILPFQTCQKFETGIIAAK